MPSKRTRRCLKEMDAENIKQNRKKNPKRCYPNRVQVNVTLAMSLFANSFKEKRQYDIHPASAYLGSNHSEDPVIAKVAAVVLI